MLILLYFKRQISICVADLHHIYKHSTNYRELYRMSDVNTVYH